MGTFSTFGKTAMLGALPSPIYAQAHSGDPGADGTLNAVAGVARVAVTLAAAAAAARAASVATYEFAMPAGSQIAYVSYWDAPTAGNFWAADQLDATEAFTGAGTYGMTVQTFSVA